MQFKRDNVASLLTIHCLHDGLCGRLVQERDRALSFGNSVILVDLDFGLSIHFVGFDRADVCKNVMDERFVRAKRICFLFVPMSYC